MLESPDISIDTDIVVSCSNENEALAIHKSLIADNIGIPAFLTLEMSVDKKDFSLLIKFTQGENRENNINTIINTIDEIMEHISLIRNVTRID